MKNIWALAVCLAGCFEGESDVPSQEAQPSASVSIGGIEYPSVESAALAAQAGDRIILGEGTILLTSPLLLREGVTLLGAGPHLTTLVGPPDAPAIRIVPANSMAQIHDLTVTGKNVGIDGAGGVVDVWNVILRDLETGIRVRDGSSARVNLVTAVGNGIAFDVGDGVFKSSNCIVNRNGIGVRAVPAALASYRYNNVAENSIADYVGAVPGPGCTSNAIPFLADCREPDRAPNVDAGDPASDFRREPESNGGRVNQGAFGNTPWAARSR